MKRITILLISLLTLTAAYAQDRQQEAAAAYTNGEFEKAITLYEQILSSDGEAAEIYYNLGNAYYKADQIGKAILNYERSLVLSPGFSDARFNLEIAQQRVTDKIEPLGEFFLVAWSQSIQHLTSANGWANIALLFFLLFLGGLVLYFFTGRVWSKKLGFFSALFALLLCIVANSYASKQVDRYTNRTRAVIQSPTVSVKSTPDANGTDLFLLHEGTTVSIKSRLGSWTEIELADGNVGWMEEKQLETI